jgi:hypothetical protein
MASLSAGMSARTDLHHGAHRLRDQLELRSQLLDGDAA